MKKTIVLVLSLIIVAGAAFATGEAEGVDFPTRSISYVIPFDPGGQSDVMAQYQRPYLEEALGVDVVIRYQPGAGGALGWSNTVKARPDGYTITGNNLPHIIIQPLVRDNAGYTTDQLKPVYLFQATPIGLAVAVDAPYNTLGELLAYAKAHPGEITVGGSGTQSGHDLALYQMQFLTGAEFTYIPSTGSSQISPKGCPTSSLPASSWSSPSALGLMWPMLPA